MPLAWRELNAGLDPARFNLRTVFRRLARQKQDPMAPLLPAAVSRQRS
jgi:DNA primase